MTTTTLKRSGPASKFPPIKKFLANYVLGLPDWGREDLARLRKYADDGGFQYPAPDGTGMWIYSLANAEGDLNRVGVALRWQAVQSALKAESGFAELWAQSAAYGYWAQRAEHRFDKFMHEDFMAGGRPQYRSTMRFRSATSILATVFLFGWHDLAKALNQLIPSGLARRGYFDIGESSHPRAQFFALRLVSEHFGVRLDFDAPYLHDEPIYEFLLQHWRSENPDHLTDVLLAALDRHTHQCVLAKRNGTSFDFEYKEDWYFPYEVLVLLRLRELVGLANPDAADLSHPLTATPFGGLPSPVPVYSDELLDGVVKRLREEFADL